MSSLTLEHSTSYFFDQQQHKLDDSSSLLLFEPFLPFDDDETLSNEFNSNNACNTAQQEDAEDDAPWDTIFDVLDDQEMKQPQQNEQADFEDDILDLLAFGATDDEADDGYFYKPEDDLIQADSAPCSWDDSITSGKRSASVVLSEPCHKKQKTIEGSNSKKNNNNNIFHINAHQASKWDSRFQELVDFKQKHGHANVPSTYQVNFALSQWVKRQRYQYRLLKAGKHTTITPERQAALEKLGFIWDLHDAVWEERLTNDLYTFKREHGHCKVPLNYPKNPELAIWAKCQRRHYISYCDAIAQGKSWTSTTMSHDRISKLAKIGFVFSNRTGHGVSDALQAQLLVAKSA